MKATDYSSSSSYSYSSSSYEVFLSFSGGAGPVKHLANTLGTGLTGAGISVFRDEWEVGADKEIDPALDEAIGQSKLSIPIISQAYASNNSCLMVLAKMLGFMDTRNHTIIPIFYKPEPYEIGSFVDPRKRGIDGKLLSWKSALHRIRQMRGYHLDPAKEPPISEIVLYVIRQLKKAELVDTSLPIGINDQVREMMTKLGVDYSSGQAVEVHGDEVRMVIIHGTGGIGKTTLAKFIYNQLYPLFEGCSYLGNIGEKLKTEPLENLQSLLVSDLLKQEPQSFDSVEGGIYFIKHRFRSMRVLIVLDDVNECHHLEAFAGKLSWFGSRSRIIATTRNTHHLKFPKEVATYEVERMDFVQSLCLFCLHAFGRSSPHDNWVYLSRRIVSIIRGLPIALEVVGSFLYRKNMQIWNEMLQKLEKEKEPVHSVQQVLMTSYEALDQETKNIFLDLACFSIGKDKRIPFYMWEDCGFNPHYGIESLLLSSLVKIEDNNELSVYDLLRDLGRTIVYEEDPKNPGRRSRLWNHKEALKTLQIKERRKAVNALCLKFDNGLHDCFTREEFQTLSQLRFLKLDNANIKGDFTKLLSNLRWLDWRGCPDTFEAMNLHLKKLVILDLSRSKVTENWQGWSQIKMPRLKVLNLTGCNEMMTTPQFSCYPQLEMLILESCFKLTTIDPSICHLTLLVSLNLKSCSSLSKLPPEMGNMEALKELLIDGTCIQEIPQSIGRMKQLEMLSASNCNSLTKLPKSICDAEALSMLLLDNVQICKFPNSIQSLVKLQRLSLRNCQGIQKLPESIGELGCSLVELDISGTSILELPDSMRSLELLRVLRMNRCHVRKIPSAIGKLTKLEEIHASQCRTLEGSIPRFIKNLELLRILILRDSCVSGLPTSVQLLSHLQTLDLLLCDSLKALPKLPSSLTCLQISSKNMSAIPDIRNLVELEDLSFGDENPKEPMDPPTEFDPASILTNPRSLWPIRFPKLKSFELSHSQIVSLGFECVPQLKKAVLTGVNLRTVSRLPSSLSVLLIQACLSLKSLPVQNLVNLSELQLLNSAVEEIEGLGGLKGLEILVALKCPIANLNGLSNLKSLKKLSLKYCNSLKLPNVSDLTKLKVLEIHRCQKIRKIEGIEELTSLEELRVSECKAENSKEVIRAQKKISRRLSTSP